MKPEHRESTSRFNQRRMALSRWDYEGGAGSGGRLQIAVGSPIPSHHRANGKGAELSDLKRRVQDLERLVILLKAENSSSISK